MAAMAPASAAVASRARSTTVTIEAQRRAARRASAGTTTSAATLGSVGTSQRKSAVAAAAPSSCAPMNPGASVGRIPVKVSDAARASVTAGLANEVEDVNQYAAVMYAATTNGTAAARVREQPQMTARSPNVATNSLNICAGPERACREARNSGSSNITCAAATPANAPATCATT